MQRLDSITEDQKKYAIDLLVTLTAEEIADQLKIDPARALSAFVASKTGKLLYDETSKLWWNGPSYIAQMFLDERE